MQYLASTPKKSQPAVCCCRFLDVSFNELKVLPQGVGCLKVLTTFNISFNPLGHFSAVLGRLQELVELNADFTGR